ncbi:MFS transporter [Streptomyces sp. NPDC048297]|uniref:MFS transporter n=1 Tax=Streptomyces sp. NPDC048297 TaxID=3365531 RepID=UPI003712CD90
MFSGSSVGLALGVPAASLLGDTLGWRAAFAALSAASTVVAVLLWRLLPEVRGAGERPVLRDAARLPGVIRSTTAWALFLLGHFVVFAYFAPYLKQLGSGMTSGLALGVLGFAGVAGVAVTGRVPDRALPRGLLWASALIASSFAALMVLPARSPYLMVILALWGASSSGNILLHQRNVLIVGQKAEAAVAGLSVLVVQAGIALGAVLGGATIQLAGISRLPLTGLASVALSAALVVRRRSKRRCDRPVAAGTGR